MNLFIPAGHDVINAPAPAILRVAGDVTEGFAQLISDGEFKLATIVPSLSTPVAQLPSYTPTQPATLVFGRSSLAFIKVFFGVHQYSYGRNYKWSYPAGVTSSLDYGREIFLTEPYITSYEKFVKVQERSAQEAGAIDLTFFDNKGKKFSSASQTFKAGDRSAILRLPNFGTETPNETGKGNAFSAQLICKFRSSEGYPFGLTQVSYETLTTNILVGDFFQDLQNKFTPQITRLAKVVTVARLSEAPIKDLYGHGYLDSSVVANFRVQPKSGNVVAGNFVAGLTYTIVSVGTTNFTLVGAANNNVDTSFIATGAGSGTGTASVAGLFGPSLIAGATASVTASVNLRDPLVLAAMPRVAASSLATATFEIGAVGAATVSGFVTLNLSVGQTELLVVEASASAEVSKADLNVSSRVSGMTLYVNLETRQFVVSPVLLSPVSSIFLTRRDTVAIDVAFIRNGRVTALSYNSTGRLGVKTSYTAAPIAIDSEWQERGSGTNTRYQFSLNMNTAGVDALFSSDNATDSATAKIELEWTEGGTLNTTLPTAATIYNDVLRDSEGVPTVTAAGSFKLLAPDASLWTVTIDNDGILTATK